MGKKLWIYFGLFVVVLVSDPNLQAQDFIKNLITQSPGPLSTHHKDWDRIDGCINCHQKALGGEIANDKCLTCHPKIELRIQEDRGFHRGKTECHTCHGEHKGLDGYIFAPDDWLSGFDHETDAQYELRGKHAQIECFECHTEYRTHYQTKAKTQTRSYLDAPVTCVGCHENVYEHDFKDKALLECTNCHSPQIDSWKSMSKPMRFDHDKQADYPLQGFHEQVSCNECHTPDPKLKRVTKFAPLEFDQCTDCHSDPHKGSFGPKCESCHSVYRKWDNILVDNKSAEAFDHSKTDFPLIGYHQAVKCEGCHDTKSKNFKVADDQFDQCSDCHGQVHGGQFAKQECTDCHQTENRWYDSLFGIEEHNKTNFKLDGKHQVIDCQKCHFSGQYENLEHDQCSDCHRNAHPERQIEQTCSFCHVTTSFSWIQFDHNQNTDFRLTGQHREVACLSCHVDQVFQNMPANNANPNCQMCHQDPHGDAIPNTCADCHRTEGFKLVRNFEHEKIGNWALEGRHAELSCQKCHSEHLKSDYSVPKYAAGAAATACLNCHADIHNGEYGPSCQSCHNFNSFEVEHGEKVHDLGYFKLAGVHDLMDCNVCHSEATSLQGTGAYCAWCHEQNDIHLGKFGNECQDCHSQTAWLPSKFKHNTTGFRLTGAHRYTDCASCHANQVYQGLPNDCYFCHSDTFLPATIVASHAGGNIDCASCHSTIDWNIQRGPGVNRTP